MSECVDWFEVNKQTAAKLRAARGINEANVTYITVLEAELARVTAERDEARQSLELNKLTIDSLIEQRDYLNDECDEWESEANENNDAYAKLQAECERLREAAESWRLFCALLNTGAHGVAYPTGIYKNTEGYSFTGTQDWMETPEAAVRAAAESLGVKGEGDAFSSS